MFMVVCSKSFLWVAHLKSEQIQFRCSLKAVFGIVGVLGLVQWPSWNVQFFSLCSVTNCMRHDRCFGLKLISVPKVLHWLHSVIVIWAAPVKNGAYLRRFTLSHYSYQFKWHFNLNGRKVCSGSIRSLVRPNVSCVREMSGRKVSIESTLKWLLTFSGLELIYGSSEGCYLTPPFWSRDPARNQTSLIIWNKSVCY